MKPLRKNVALAIDGGGIRGVIVAKALAMVEQELQQPLSRLCRLVAGTSTGAIITTAIASGMTASQLFDLYVLLGKTIFKKTWRSHFFPLTRYRYSPEPLKSQLSKHLGSRKMSDFWLASPPTDVVITAFDLIRNHTCFIKPWKTEYADWSIEQAVLASSSVPTYFPPVLGRYVDGGVGSYANPCYLAAYESQFCLNWNPNETTLISLGTGRSPHSIHNPQAILKLSPWEWISPMFGAFMQSADDQQVHLVHNFFPEIDFRRFQIDLQQPFEMDDVDKIDQLAAYGEDLGRMILNDTLDPILDISTPKAPVKISK
mgnify:CR=1 FL=1